jgi:hypothetical protein
VTTKSLLTPVALPFGSANANVVVFTGTDPDGSVYASKEKVLCVSRKLAIENFVA